MNVSNHMQVDYNAARTDNLIPLDQSVNPYLQTARYEGGAWIVSGTDPLAVLDAARAAGHVSDFGLDQPTLSQLFMSAVGDLAAVS